MSARLEIWIIGRSRLASLIARFNKTRTLYRASKLPGCAALPDVAWPAARSAALWAFCRRLLSTFPSVFTTKKPGDPRQQAKCTNADFLLPGYLIRLCCFAGKRREEPRSPCRAARLLSTFPSDRQQSLRYPGNAARQTFWLNNYRLPNVPEKTFFAFFSYNEAAARAIIDGRCASRISSKFSPAPENA